MVLLSHPTQFLALFFLPWLVLISHLLKHLSLCRSVLSRIPNASPLRNREAQNKTSLRLWEAVTKGLEEAAVKKCPSDGKSSFYITTYYIWEFLDTNQFSADYLCCTWSLCSPNVFLNGTKMEEIWATLRRLSFDQSIMHNKNERDESLPSKTCRLRSDWLRVDDSI